MILESVRIGLALLAKRLVKLPPVSSSAAPGRIAFTAPDNDRTASLIALTLKSRAFGQPLSAGLAEAGLLRP